MSDSTRPEGGARSRRTAAEASVVGGERLRGATEAARQSMADARRFAETGAERGKDRGAAEVHHWAGALDRAARELGTETAQGRLVRSVSEQIGELARSIERRSTGDTLGDLADFGRRNPAAFAGGAILAGFALSRLATASRPASHEDEEDMR